MEKTVTVFSINIKKLRRARGLTQENIADLFGMKRSTYSAWEIGYTEPSIWNLYKLAKLYKIRVEHLLEKELEHEFIMNIKRKLWKI